MEVRGRHAEQLMSAMQFVRLGKPGVQQSCEAPMHRCTMHLWPRASEGHHGQAVPTGISDKTMCVAQEEGNRKASNVIPAQCYATAQKVALLPLVAVQA